MTRRTFVALAAAAVLAAAVIIIAVAGGGDDGGPSGKAAPTATPGAVTVTLGGQGRRRVTLPPAAQQVAAAQRAEDARGQTARAESDLNAPAPPGDVVAATRRLAPAGQPPIPHDVPQAAPSAPGCTSAFVRNQSSRNGAPVLLGMIHWTASRNLPGTADGLGIVRWFDTPAAQASSNYVTDDEGHCWYTVPETAKAWTQAGANPWALSVEVINPGVLPLFGQAAGRRAVVALMRGWHKRWGLPYRRAAVTGGCVPTRSGFLAHRDLGACGGGHPDVGPDPATLNGLLAAARRPPAAPAGVRRRCRRIAAYRRTGRRDNRYQNARQAYVHRRGYSCADNGRPVRRH